MRLAAILLLISLLSGQFSLSSPKLNDPESKYILIFIGDGQGANHLLAANRYSGAIPEYQSWSQYWLATYPEGGAYDPQLAWSDFAYLSQGYTDSAAAATALFSGVKTANGRINVSADGASRLVNLAEVAHQRGLGVGVVTSVYVSHATPGAWFSHNLSRHNGFAIADEMFWGDPTTTGSETDPNYAGGMGMSLPPPEVVIGAGHPSWSGGNYVNETMRLKLQNDSLANPNFAFVERQAGNPDGGPRLLAAANDPDTRRLVGLFGGAGGNLEYQLANGSGGQPENPTLAEMVLAALTVLERNNSGFVLMVESGAIDWASHANDMDAMLGEQMALNAAVQTAIEWVDSPGNDSVWQNTLFLVTADHETGYLTAGPGIAPDQPLGEISPRTLSLEKTQADTNLAASWEDLNGNQLIDAGETVFWAWNSKSHTNSLIPLYAKGVGAESFSAHAIGADPVRGDYLDNTALGKITAQFLRGEIPVFYRYFPLLSP